MMQYILTLSTLIFLFYSTLAVRAQLTLFSAATISFTSISSSPDVVWTTKSFYIPQVNLNNSVLKAEFYVFNETLLAIFSVYDKINYLSWLNKGTMFDISNWPMANLSSCIQSCIDHTEKDLSDVEPTCTGVAYIDDLCWLKTRIYEDSVSIKKSDAVSAIMNLLHLASISWFL